MSEEVLQKLRSYVLATYLPAEDPAMLKDDTRLISSGIIDSVAVLEMVAWIEKAFDVRLEEDDLRRERLDTIASIAALVAERKA